MSGVFVFYSFQLEARKAVFKNSTVASGWSRAVSSQSFGFDLQRFGHTGVFFHRLIRGKH